MNTATEKHAMFYLIDDDPYSARYLMRKLESDDGHAPAITCKWFESAARGADALAALRQDGAAGKPDLIVVDLKSNSLANEEFIRSTSDKAERAGIPIVALVGKTDPDLQQSLYEAGARSVFERRVAVKEFKAGLAGPAI